MSGYCPVLHETVNMGDNFGFTRERPAPLRRVLAECYYLDEICLCVE